jgi:hypothetical protein
VTRDPVLAALGSTSAQFIGTSGFSVQMRSSRTVRYIVAVRRPSPRAHGITRRLQITENQSARPQSLA